MSERKQSLAFVASGLFSLQLSASQQARSAEPEQMPRSTSTVHQTTASINELRTENESAAHTVGRWDVTETVWSSPGAAPVETTGLIAQRQMTGLMLLETLRSISDPARTLRIDYLTVNRVEGRWEYVSMNTRAAVGMMTGQSYGRGDGNRVLITFQPFSVLGSSQKIIGQMLRMRQDIIAFGLNHAAKDQYFIMANGNGVEWLAHRYAYVRHN